MWLHLFGFQLYRRVVLDRLCFWTPDHHGKLVYVNLVSWIEYQEALSFLSRYFL